MASTWGMRMRTAFLVNWDNNLTKINSRKEAVEACEKTYLINPTYLDNVASLVG